MMDKKIMVYSKSTIGKLLYGTVSEIRNNSITLTDCVEIDFLDYIDNPNIGILANDVDSLRKCVISSTIACITSFEVVFMFNCSQAVQDYLNAKALDNGKENNNSSTTNQNVRQVQVH